MKSELEKQCTALMIVTPKEVSDSYDTMSKNFGHSVSSSLSCTRKDSEIYEKGFRSGKDAMQQRSIEGGN